LKNNEQFYKIKNNNTGEIQTIEFGDIRKKKQPPDVKAKQALPEFFIKETNMPTEQKARLLEKAGYKKQADKLRVSDAKNIVAWVLRKGGINFKNEHWKGELNKLKDALNQGKRMGFGSKIINPKGKHTLDELSLMAQSEGFISEASPQALLDALHAKKLSLSEIEKAAETFIPKAELDLTKIKKGDKVFIDGEQVLLEENQPMLHTLPNKIRGDTNNFEKHQQETLTADAIQKDLDFFEQRFGFRIEVQQKGKVGAKEQTLAQKQGRGDVMASFTPNEMIGIIKLFPSADATSFPHEAGHAAMEVFRRAANYGSKEAQHIINLTTKYYPDKEDFASAMSKAWIEYNGGKKAKIPFSIGRIFRELFNFFTRIKNSLQGMGFQTKEDLQQDILEGKYKDMIKQTPKIERIVSSSIGTGQFVNYKITFPDGHHEIVSTKKMAAKAIRNFEFQLIKSFKGKIQEGQAKLYAGIPIDKNSVTKLRDTLVNKFPKLENLLGLPSDITKKSKKPMGINSTRGFLILPETLAKRYGKIYPEINNIYQFMRTRYSQANNGVFEIDRLWKKINSFGNIDIQKAINVYKLSSNENALSSKFNSLTPTQKNIFGIIERKMKAIHADHINITKQAIIDYINITPTIKNPATKAQYVKAVINMKPSWVEHKTIKGFIERLQTTSGKVKYYSPQVREGKYIVRISNENKTLFAKSFDTETEAIKFKQELNKGNFEAINNWFKQADIKFSKELVDSIKNGNYEIDHTPLIQTPFEAVEGLDLSGALNFIETMIADKTDHTAEIYKEVAEKLLELNLSKGWSKHKIHRENIPGYELESDKVQKQLERYMKGYEYSKAKGEAMKNTAKEWSKLVSKNRYTPPDLIIHMKDYIDYVFGTPETQASTKTAHGISTFYLIANMASSVINSTQNLTIGNTVLIEHGLPIWNPSTVVDIHLKNLSFSEKKALVKLMKLGYGEMVYDEMLGRSREYSEVVKDLLQDVKGLKKINLGNMGHILGDAVNVGMMSFKHVETYINRLPMYLHTYRALIKRGETQNKAIETATEVMLEAHFEAMRFNRAKFQRGNFGRPLTALMTYNVHAMKTLNRLFHNAGFNNKDAMRSTAALSYVLAAHIVIGGMAALPLIGIGSEGWELLKWLYKQSTGGRNLNADIKSMPPAVSDFVQGGILRLAGLGGLSSRLSFGMSVTDPTKNIVGINLLRRTKESYDLLQEGQDDRALMRLLPGGLRYMGEAYLGAKYGLTSKTGTPLMDEEGEKIMPTTEETILKGFGVDSNRIINIKENVGMVRETERARQLSLAQFRNAIIKAKTDDEKIAIWEQLEDYNDKLAERYFKAEESDNEEEMARIAILYINKKDLIGSIRSKSAGVIVSRKGKAYLRALAEE